MRNTRNVDVKSLLQPCVVRVLSWVHIGTVISASKSPWMNSQEHVARCKLITISELKCLISHRAPNNWRMQKDFLLWRQTYGPIGLPKCVHETNTYIDDAYSNVALYWDTHTNGLGSLRDHDARAYQWTFQILPPITTIVVAMIVVDVIGIDLSILDASFWKSSVTSIPSEYDWDISAKLVQ